MSVTSAIPVNLDFWKMCYLSLTSADAEAIAGLNRNGRLPIDAQIATATAARAIVSGMLLVSGTANAHYKSLEAHEQQGFHSELLMFKYVKVLQSQRPSKVNEVVFGTFLSSSRMPGYWGPCILRLHIGGMPTKPCEVCGKISIIILQKWTLA